MTLSDHNGLFSYLKLFQLRFIGGGLTRINYDVCTHEQEIICGIQSQLFVENERLFKVTGSHVHCESDSISKMAQDRHVAALLQTTNRECHIWPIDSCHFQ